MAGSRPLSVVAAGTVGPGAERAVSRRKPPAAPRHLDARLKRRWRSLWAENGDLLDPVVDVPACERLFDLYTMLGRPSLSANEYVRVAAEARQLEDRVGGSPRARLTLAAAIEAAGGGGLPGPAGANLDDLVDEANEAGG